MKTNKALIVLSAALLFFTVNIDFVQAKGMSGGNTPETAETANEVADPAESIVSKFLKILSRDTPEKKTTVSAPNPKESAALIDWMKGGTYYFTYTHDIELGKDKIASKGSVAADGKNMAVTTEIPVSGMTMKTRIIILGDLTYVIDDMNKTITSIKSSTQNKSGEQVTDFSKIVYVGSGRGTVKGRNLPYEEYKAEGATIKYYIDGDKVYAIETLAKGTKSLMVLENQSKTIPRGSFDLPKGYKTVSF